MEVKHFTYLANMPEFPKIVCKSNVCIPLKYYLVPIKPLDFRARHPIAAVLGCVVVVDHDAVADDGGGARQWQAAVREEAACAADVSAAAGDLEAGVLVLEVSDLAMARRLS